MDPPIDPDDHTVSALKTALEDVDDADALAAVLEAERAGSDRTTAVAAIEDRLGAVGVDPAGATADGPVESPDAQPSEAPAVQISLQAALRYPWDGGAAGVTLVVGGVLTLLSPLLVPGVIVLGYGLRVVEGVLDGKERPPTFGDWESMVVDGVKGAIVLLAYVALPLGVGTALVTAVAGAAGVRFIGGMASLPGSGAVGAIAFGLVLLLAGLALVVWYLAPAALVHLGRTRSLRAAFDVEAVRRLATSDAYGSAWLLALVVFAAAGLVLTVLYAAAIGVIVSGFVTFYVFVAMAYLYARGAGAAGFELEIRPEDGEADA